MHLFNLARRSSLIRRFSSSISSPLTTFVPPPPHPSLPTLLPLLSHPASLSLLRSSPIRPTKDLVLAAMWETRAHPESVLLSLRWGEDCVSDSPYAWELAIWALGCQQRFPEAWNVLRRMRRWNLSVRRGLVIMMESYVAANDATKAIRTFHAMEKFKIIADSTAFYALLRALCKYKNVEEAEELLFNDRKLFPLETKGFNIILDGWCNVIGDLTEAKRVWREMSNYCIYPDDASYTHMICCFSKAGNLFDSLRLCDEMKKRGWVPGMEVYNSLIYVLARENCMKEAYAIFDKIKEDGLEPDIDTYISIIYPLCEAHKLDDAHHVLESMIERGIKPTDEIYHAFVEVECPEGALDLIERMKSAKCGPNNQTFLLIFRKLFRLNQPEYVLRLWSQMEMYDVKSDASLYFEVVHGLAKSGQVLEARNFYHEMVSKGFPADPKTEKLLRKLVPDHESHGGVVGKKHDALHRRGKSLWEEKIFI